MLRTVYAGKLNRKQALSRKQYLRCSVFAVVNVLLQHELYPYRHRDKV